MKSVREEIKDHHRHSGADDGKEGQRGREAEREGCNLLGSQRNGDGGRRGHRGEEDHSILMISLPAPLWVCECLCVGALPWQ